MCHVPAIGVFITLEPQSQDMETEAVTADYYESPWFERSRRIQNFTTEQLLKGAGADAADRTELQASAKGGAGQARPNDAGRGIRACWVLSRNQGCIRLATSRKASICSPLSTNSVLQSIASTFCAFTSCRNSSTCSSIITCSIT